MLMYLGIDVGASKTLLALFDNTGNLLQKTGFATPDSASSFLDQALAHYHQLRGRSRVRAAGLGLPCAIDYEGQTVLACHNLDWLTPDFPHQLGKQLKLPLHFANDTLLAGWSEAAMGAGVGTASMLYVTLSTGIGTSFMTNGAPHPAWLRSEGGQMVVRNEGQALHRLEELVSGPAIKDRFGRFGYEISEPPIWDAIARDLALGLFNMISLTQPKLVVVGGGLAMHFEAYRRPLRKYLDQLNPGLYPTPPLKAAHHIETAVAYGCYLIAKLGLKA